MNMRNKLSIIPLLLLITGGCRILSVDEYNRYFRETAIPATGEAILGILPFDTGILYLATVPAAAVILLLSLMLYFFNRKNTHYLFLGLSALTAGGLYLVPLLERIPRLPRPEVLLPQATIFLMLLFFIFHRQWSRRIMHHRKKLWVQITLPSLMTITLLATLLTWFRPGLTAVPWPGPVLAAALLADMTVCSILSFQRRYDRSGVGGLLLLTPVAASAVWLLLSRGYSHDLFGFLHSVLYLSVCIALPLQFLMTVFLTQSHGRRQQQTIKTLSDMARRLEEEKENQADRIETLTEEKENAALIPDFNRNAARKLLDADPLPPLSLPEGWEGAHFLSSESTGWPFLGAWSAHTHGKDTSESLFTAESEPDQKEALPALLYLKEQYRRLIHRDQSPVSLLSELNKSLIRIEGDLPRPLTGTYLHLVPDGLICATAGPARVYYRSADGKTAPVSSRETPATLKQGLGVRALSRETGMPFRLSLQSGDTVVVASRSLLHREQELTGELYGPASLVKILERNRDNSARHLMELILKDFDDFDMGNTRDRQIYLAVLRKL